MGSYFNFILMRQKLFSLFNSSCNPSITIDARFKYVYINDVLHISENNGAYLVDNQDNSFTLLLWQRGMLLSKKPILLSKYIKRENPRTGIHLKDDDNRKYFISEDIITVYEEGVITEYTNEKL